jgi:hypothetical protein
MNASRDPLNNTAYRLVRHPEVSRHRPKPLLLHPNGDLSPSLTWNTRTFRRRGIPADPRSSSCVEQPLRIQERHQRRCDHVYLAQAIPVASAR